MKGSKVFLVSFDTAFVPDRVRWMNDPNFRKQLNAPYPVSERSTLRWLDRVIGDPSQIDLIICESDGGRPIGYTGFRGIDLANQKAESYTGIGEPEFRGAGFAREAKVLALQYLFNRWRINMVYALIRPENPAAIRLYHSIGYKTDGVLRNYLYSHGEFRDMAFLSLLKADFKAQDTRDE